MRVLFSFLHINRKPVIFSHQLQISAYRLTTIETVVVLGRQRIDSHISVDLDVKKLGIKSGNSTYDDIKAYVREKYGFEVHSAYIGQVKEKLGIRERKNYNVGSGKRPMPLCPPEKEEAIKDALRHFGLI